MMLTLVTGATGFVGAALVRHLCQAGHPVRALVRVGRDYRALAALGVEAQVGDLRDSASLQRALQGCRYLFHVAADYRLWVPDAASMYATNVDGTRALMEAALAAGVERIVYTSSVATLGLPPQGGSGDEDTPVTLEDMVGPYKRSKFLAEATVQQLIKTRGLPAVIVNPATVIGAGDWQPTPTGRMIVRAAAGRMPAYMDTGLNLVHVEEVAHGHVLALQRGRIGERYILGGENLSLHAILSHIANLVGRPAPRWRLPYGAALALGWAFERWARVVDGIPLATVDEVKMARKKMFFSSCKAEAELGYRICPAQPALAQAVSWFREHGYF